MTSPRPRTSRLSVEVLLAGLLLAPLSAQSPCGAWTGLGTSVPGVTGPFGNALTNAIVQFAGPQGPRIAVGGSFAVAGNVAASNVAIFDVQANQWTSLPGPGGVQGVDDTVEDLAFDAATGRLIVVGRFTTAGGITVNGVAAWNDVTGTWAPLGTGLGATSGIPVGRTVLVGANGTILVGGSFTVAGGVAANNVASFNGTTWSNLGTGLTGASAEVRGIAQRPNGNVLVGGTFTQAGGTAANNVAEWNGTSWSALGAGTNGTVHAVVLDSNGALYAGGAFTQAGGFAASNLARWNGSFWFTPLGPNGTVRDLALQPNGTILLGGGFVTAGGVTVNSIARFDGTSTYTVLASGFGGLVNGVFAVDDTIALAAGQFVNPIGAPNIDFLNLARFDGTIWNGLGAATGLYGLPPGVGGAVFAIAQANGVEIAAGVFPFAGAVGGSPVGFFDAINGTWRPFTITGSPGTARALAPLPAPFGVPAFVVGGLFTWTSGASTLVNIAEWNGTNWVPLGSGVNGEVRALLVVGNSVFVGGTFTLAGSVAASNVAVFHRTGQTWRPLGNGTNGPVQALALAPSGNIIAGGAFTTAGGLAMSNVAIWSPTAQAWRSMGSGTNAAVNALTVRPLSGEIVAGGSFTMADGASANRVAAWNGTAWTPLGSGVNGAVFALAAMPNDDVFAGGDFTAAGGNPANFVAHWNGSQWLDLNGGTDTVVWSMFPVGNLAVRAGGDFTTTGGVANPHHATFAAIPSCQPAVTGVLNFCLSPTGNSTILSVGPGQQPTIGIPFLTRTVAIPSNFLSLFAWRNGTTLVPLQVSSTCFLDFTPEVYAVPVLGPSGLTWDHTFLIPNDITAVGSILQEQAIHFELANPSNAGTSNRLTITIGGF